MHGGKAAPYTCQQPHTKASFFASSSAAWSEASDLSSSDELVLLGSAASCRDHGSGRKRKLAAQKSLRPRLQLRRSTSSQLSEQLCMAAVASAGALACLCQAGLNSAADPQLTRV